MTLTGNTITLNTILANSVERVRDAIRFVLANVLEAPLRTLYFEGPTLYGYGFWNGISPPEICSVITRTSVAMWTANADTILECNHIIAKHFHAFYILVLVFAYFHILLQCWYCVKALLLRGSNRIFRKQKCNKYRLTGGRVLVLDE